MDIIAIFTDYNLIFCVWKNAYMLHIIIMNTKIYSNVLLKILVKTCLKIHKILCFECNKLADAIY